MSVEDRIKVFASLGQRLGNLSSGELQDILYGAKAENGWFIPENVTFALKSLSKMLDLDKLRSWVSSYGEVDAKAKDVGIVMAGNIPLVGFHDLLSVLISGHKASVKTSSKDTFLIKKVVEWIAKESPELAEQVTFPDRLNNVEAIIATGSDNTARYFEQYFGHMPRVIRKNRSSIAVLSGDESEKDFEDLGEDVFSYFGLGCRNVSKILAPKGFDIRKAFPSFEKYASVSNCHKYQNNYDYNKSIYLINGVDHLDTGFGLFKEDEGLVSPISCVFYAYYEDIDAVSSFVDLQSEKLQCIVSNSFESDKTISFGQAQFPALDDYADGVDTLKFLNEL